MAGKFLHSPEQRIILGATALATQPFIDLNNKNVDKETRELSAARTVAKIIAGTFVGVVVRYLGIGFVKKFSNYNVFTKNGLVESFKPASSKDFLTPSSFAGIDISKLSPEKLGEYFDKYRKGMGTLLATVVMIATNFLCDAPLTKMLTPYFAKHIRSDVKVPDGKEIK